MALIVTLIAVGFLLALLILVPVACWLIVAALPAPKPRPIPPASASLASSERR